MSGAGGAERSEALCVPGEGKEKGLSSGRQLASARSLERTAAGAGADMMGKVSWWCGGVIRATMVVVVVTPAVVIPQSYV